MSDITDAYARPEEPTRHAARDETGSHARSGLKLLTAAWVCPVDAPAIERGGVLFDGPTIRAVDRLDRLERHLAGAIREDAGDAVLLPGLINAHTHLCLSDLSTSDPEANGLRNDFGAWLLSIGKRLKPTEADYADRMTEAMRRGAKESLEHGVTCVGDIAPRLAEADVCVERALSDVPIRCVSFFELLGLGEMRGAFTEQFERVRRWVVERPFGAMRRLNVGISPHAPYTVDVEGFAEVVDFARQGGGRVPLMTHAAEHAGEEDFLRESSGAMAALYQKIGRSLAGVSRFDGTSIGMLDSVGMLEMGAVLAHVNYPTGDDLDLLARHGAAVVYCPRTHEYFGHAVHPIERMMEMGIAVSLGTDSRASSPDLDVLSEARCVRRKFPGIDPGRLLQTITSNPARALGLGEVVGTLSPGKRADVCAVGIGAGRGWETILDDVSGERAVWIEGERV